MERSHLLLKAAGEHRPKPVSQLPVFIHRGPGEVIGVPGQIILDLINAGVISVAVKRHDLFLDHRQLGERLVFKLRNRTLDVFPGLAPAYGRQLVGAPEPPAG